MAETTQVDETKTQNLRNQPNHPVQPVRKSDQGVLTALSLEGLAKKVIGRVLASALKLGVFYVEMY